MNNDNPIDRDLREELKAKGGNVSLVARQTDVAYEYLKQLAERDAPIVRSFEPSNAALPKDIKTLGKKGFERFVVAVKVRGKAWPLIFSNQIQDARRKFDAGTHEMFQTTSGQFVVQYLIPRRRPVEPRKFFRSLHLV